MILISIIYVVNNKVLVPTENKVSFYATATFDCIQTFTNVKVYSFLF